MFPASAEPMTQMGRATSATCPGLVCGDCPLEACGSSAFLLTRITLHANADVIRTSLERNVVVSNTLVKPGSSAGAGLRLRTLRAARHRYRL